MTFKITQPDKLRKIKCSRCGHFLQNHWKKLVTVNGKNDYLPQQNCKISGCKCLEFYNSEIPKGGNLKWLEDIYSAKKVNKENLK